MFWRVPSYSQASPLEGILDKQEFTLEELLDEEDLIQVVHIWTFFCPGRGSQRRLAVATKVVLPVSSSQVCQHT